MAADKFAVSSRTPVSLLVMGLMVAATLVATLMALQHERNKAETVAREASMSVAGVLDSSLLGAEGAIAGTNGLIAASGRVNPEGFRAYGQSMFETTGLCAVAWVERVQSRGRGSFEARTGIAILERGPTGSIIPAQEREVHYPTTLSVSKDLPATPVGTDIGADPAQLAAIERAIDRTDLSVAGPVPLLRDGPEGLVIVRPLFTGGETPIDPVSRRAALRGLSSGSFALEDLLAPALATAPPGLTVAVSVDGRSLTPGVVVDPGEGVRSAIDFGGRRFEVLVRRPGASIALPAVTLVGGLALTVLAALLLLVVARRDSALERAVADATEGLRASRESHRALVENSPDVVARYSMDLVCGYMSPNVARCTGRGPHHYVGRPVERMGLPEALTDRLRRALERVRETGSGTAFTFTFPSDEDERHCETRLVPERGQDGEPISILTTTRDITAMTLAERELRASEERNRSLVAAMANGVIVQVEGGAVIDCNPVAEEILGLSRAEMIGSAPLDPGRRAIHEDGSPFPGELHPAMVTLRTGRAMRDVVMGVERTDGSRIWVSVSTEPFSSEGRRAVVTSVADITARLEAEREQAALRRLATLVAQQASAQVVFDAIAAEAAAAMQADAAAVMRFEQGRLSTVIRGSWPPVDTNDPIRREPVRIVESTAVGRVAIGGRSARVDADGEDYRCAGILGDAPVSSVVAAPIVVDGVLWGALAVVDAHGRSLPADTERLLTRMSEIATLAISSSQARAQLALMASTDHLTGLWNRRVFNERLSAELSRARRHARPLSVVMVDVDHFKHVNDVHGHAMGDAVLVDFARRLEATVRAGEIAARIGGEEFAWILPETGAAEAVAAAERLRALVESEPFEGAGTVTVSLGVAGLADIDLGDDLVAAADGALYRAKQAGRNIVARHTRDMPVTGVTVLAQSPMPMSPEGPGGAGPDS